MGSTRRHALPVQVFVLSGQSNAFGMAHLDHLTSLVNGTATSYLESTYQRLWNGTSFVQRDDVFVKFGYKRSGNLQVGGFAPRLKFGPKVGLGWAVGDAIDAPVVIIKAAFSDACVSI